MTIESLWMIWAVMVGLVVSGLYHHFRANPVVWMRRRNSSDDHK